MSADNMPIRMHHLKMLSPMAPVAPGDVIVTWVTPNERRHCMEDDVISNWGWNLTQAEALELCGKTCRQLEVEKVYCNEFIRAVRNMIRYRLSQ